MTTPYFFVLGAPDHEMQEIARVCRERGLAHGHALIEGRIVHSHQAYDATGVRGVIPSGYHIVFVECAVMGLYPDVVIDHHKPGDPGYGKTPEQYLEGSSLGQFLELVGMEPTQRQRVIAAADHCLTAAYAERCPGVTREELQAFRQETRSMARRIPEHELLRQVNEAVSVLMQAPKIMLAGHSVAWIEEPPAEVSEASARLGLPYAYVRQENDGRIKAGIRSAPAPVVEEWMDKCGLQSLYGDPQRGFAGGYFEAPSRQAGSRQSLN